jgi:hypothetical protein
MLTGLKKVVAYGYGAGACGIGGGISPQASDRDNFGLVLEGVQEAHVKGGFAASEFIVEHSKNKPDYQIGWDVGNEEGGPGIGFTIRQKYLDCGFVDIKDTHIVSCLGGTRSSGIGNGLTSKANVRITNSIIDLVKGGAGGAAIGGGSLYLNCGVGQSEDSSVFVKIIGSVITGYGGEYGPIIGSGYYVKRKYNDLVMPVTTIEIDSSIVSGMPGRLAAGIGSGNLGGLVSGYISKDSLMHIELNREADNDTWQQYSLKPFAQATLFGHGVTDLFEGNVALLRNDVDLKQWFETGNYPYKLIYKKDKRKARTNAEYITMEPYKHTLETIAWMTSYLAKYIDISTGNGEAYVYFYDPATDFSTWTEDQLKDFFIDENNDSLHDIPSNIPWTAEVSGYNKHFIRLKYIVGYGAWVDEDYPSSPWKSG